MAKTFNTCADLNIKRQKTELGCENKFTASVTVGRGQGLTCLWILKVPDFTLPPVPSSAGEAKWTLSLERDGKLIANIQLTPDAPIRVDFAASAATDTVYVASLLLVKSDGNSSIPTEDQLEAAFGKLPPISIVFEVA